VATNKEKTYQIRLPAELLEKFRAAARVKDRSPAGEIREFMRRYVSKAANTQLPRNHVLDNENEDEDLPF
jgi:hypothetical protein